MQRLPYTLEEAKVICKRYQALVGQPFDNNLPEIGNIECVAISPFDLVNKKKFLLNYLLINDVDIALREEYNGLLYDVIVIAREIGDCNNILHYDIDTWLKKNSYALHSIE